MAGQSSHSYKQYARKQRRLISEGVFTGGMHYTDNPLMPGTSRLIVNMIQKDFGARVRPRGGWRTLMEPTALGTGLGEMYIHHTGTAFVTNTATEEVFLRRYALILAMSDDKKYGSLTNSKILIEEPLVVTDPRFGIDPGRLIVSNLKSGATAYKIKHNPQDALTRLHEVNVDAPSPLGMHASIEGNTYLLTPEGLGRLEITHTDGAYQHEVKLVTPVDVTPLQAINYGYNMLLPDPYNFANKQAGTFRPLGILPYDATTNLIKMQAKVGEPVRFKLVYEYEPDVEYKVQWEIQDILKRDGVTVIVAKEDSPAVKNGADMFVDFTSPLKQFSVVATIYKTTDMAKPIRVALLASYHLSDDSNTAPYKDQKNFDLKTAKGIAVWKNQIVYFGVAGAEMSIFISDVNDPTYVPFPNQAVTFNEKVIKVFPHMDSLLVITEHTMFQVDFALESGYTSKPTQSNMQLRDDDAASMYGVRNMVCFKSRNYYYMVVPNIKNDKGELQVAPISNSITMLLDSFHASVRKILSEVYTLRHLFNAPDEAILLTLQDYSSYADGNRLRHVYKLKITVYEKEYYLDFHLIYDTIFRTWSTEVMETTRSPLHVFQSLSTGYSQFLGLYTVDDITYTQWVGIDENNPEDTFHLDDDRVRTVPNFQMLDTGKRDLNGTQKKRLRQAVLEINNLSKEDIEFNHMVYVDDDPRTDLFGYQVVHEKDPMSPNYGQIYVEREYLAPTVVYGTSKLGTWSLGNSQFPEQTVLKVHLDISGKGYYPRIRIVTRTSKLYELNQIGWAYRDMNAR